MMHKIRMSVVKVCSLLCQNNVHVPSCHYRTLRILCKWTAVHLLHKYDLLNFSSVYILISFLQNNTCVSSSSSSSSSSSVFVCPQVGNGAATAYVSYKKLNKTIFGKCVHVLVMWSTHALCLFIYSLILFLFIFCRWSNGKRIAGLLSLNKNRKNSYKSQWGNQDTYGTS